MSDSIDRVFVRAINTIRTLSSRPGYSSRPRPPIESRIQLYGMYKQATEGDVMGVMARPVGDSEIDVAGQKKWDAWKQQQGLSKTEAKRRYVSFLISLMNTHASDTHEGRELLAELEYMWDQIKDVASDSEGAEEELYEDAVEYPSRSALARAEMGATPSHVSHASGGGGPHGSAMGGGSSRAQQGSVLTHGSGNSRTHLSALAPHPQSHLVHSQHQQQPHTPPIPSDRFKSDMAWALRTINEEMADMAKQYRPSDPSEPRRNWRRRVMCLLRAIGVHVGIDLVLFAILAAILKARRGKGVSRGVVSPVETLPTGVLTLASLGEHLSYHFIQMANGVYGYAAAWISMS
ncbi:Autophagy-related protein 37 [Yarrowia sp. C11]|nr:Autophagy-related protein 37 [Yarrowia sp. C11]KAG5364864.1 Autophagy-related protein 37 [Yarrowia sp. E02]